MDQLRFVNCALLLAFYFHYITKSGVFLHMRDFLPPRIIQAFGKLNVKGMFQFFSNRIFGYYFAAFYFLIRDAFSLMFSARSS